MALWLPHTYHSPKQMIAWQVISGHSHPCFNPIRIHQTCESTCPLHDGYARSEYGRADAAKLLQPRPAPTPAGAEAIRQAKREGLTLTTSGNSNTGYKGVTFCPNQTGSKKYKLAVRVGGKVAFLSWFATAEEAALFYARREAGMDTLASDLTAPPPPPPPPSSTSAELPVYELSILTPEQMAAVPNSPPSNLDYSRARRRGVWRQAHDYAAALAAAPTYGSPSGSASART